jgi:hypothetical protein
MPSNVTAFPATLLSQVRIAQAATEIAAHAYAVPLARLLADGMLLHSRPEAADMDGRLIDAWDLAAWLTWRWISNGDLLIGSLGEIGICDLGAALIRIKGSFGDQAAFNTVAKAEYEMHGRLGRPHARGVELIMPASQCQAVLAENGIPKFRAPHRVVLSEAAP